MTLFVCLLWLLSYCVSVCQYFRRSPFTVYLHLQELPTSPFKSGLFPASNSGEYLSGMESDGVHIVMEERKSSGRKDVAFSVGNERFIRSNDEFAIGGGNGGGDASGPFLETETDSEADDSSAQDYEDEDNLPFAFALSGVSVRGSEEEDIHADVGGKGLTSGAIAVPGVLPSNRDGSEVGGGDNTLHTTTTSRGRDVSAEEKSTGLGEWLARVDSVPLHLFLMM